MIKIRLFFDSWNIKHIARHHVGQEEVEEVCYGNPLIQKGYKGRISVLGKTDSGRILFIILEPIGKGKYYPVTAYDASPKAQALYARKKGGGNSDKK